MTTLLIILIIATSVLLSFFVLIQNPKGGGLSSGFAGGSNIMGVKRTSDFLEKGTWALVIALMVFCLAINIVGPSGSSTTGGGLGDQIEAPQQVPNLNLNNTAPGTTSPAPAQTPADTAN
ncbi:preprotein translocase subunit SecG [Sphingobacterium hungaricum]|uniref:Protein-export membrane protein SecG n=1 Tax=Sphingobacterium hungaricum TaxID=2082723 RepID=A0A928YRB1_9SPHI|nr:preprotein translocase subunit SecG [Sphingobacterium hungaricum]MBE8713940.1 preprotein translocase subunit SecG [Sphingobacterium hungaricum]